MTTQLLETAPKNKLLARGKKGCKRGEKRGENGAETAKTEDLFVRFCVCGAFQLFNERCCCVVEGREMFWASS
jgi:hypothetical protein